VLKKKKDPVKIHTIPLPFYGLFVTEGLLEVSWFFLYIWGSHIGDGIPCALIFIKISFGR
jgi:hypothetical protein